MRSANVRIIPNFITARTPQSLRSTFLKLQVRTGKQYKIQDIVFDGKRWVLWYYDDATDIEVVNQSLAKDLKDGN